MMKKYILVCMIFSLVLPDITAGPLADLLFGEEEIEETDKKSTKSTKDNSDMPNREYIPALYTAVVSNDLGTVAKLILEGVNVNEKPIPGKYSNWKVGYPPITQATDTAIIDLLIKKGADINTIGENGLTILMKSAMYSARPGYSIMSRLNYLIKNGANLNIKDVNGDTALLLAIKEGARIDVIKKLISAGADVNLANANGQTPLMLAVSDKKIRNPNTMEIDSIAPDLEVIKVLKKDGKANVTIKDLDGKTAIDYTTDDTVKLILNK